MTLGKIQVRHQAGESGSLGTMNPVVGMTTIGLGVIQRLNTDGTVVVSGNTNIGGSGVGVAAAEVFVFEDQASGILPGGAFGSWPSGVDVQLHNWENRTYKTTTH